VPTSSTLPARRVEGKAGGGGTGPGLCAAAKSEQASTDPARRPRLTPLDDDGDGIAREQWELRIVGAILGARRLSKHQIRADLTVWDERLLSVIVGLANPSGREIEAYG
jgi:hypothetical protein